jgi:hypothetical protein
MTRLGRCPNVWRMGRLVQSVDGVGAVDLVVELTVQRAGRYTPTVRIVQRVRDWLTTVRTRALIDERECRHDGHFPMCLKCASVLNCTP